MLARKRHVHFLIPETWQCDCDGDTVFAGEVEVTGLEMRSSRVTQLALNSFTRVLLS